MMKGGGRLGRLSPDFFSATDSRQHDKEKPKDGASRDGSALVSMRRP
jgi:hypothetical protein